MIDETGPLLVAGRPVRVALLVYNDSHADSRVLKTARSLRLAGAEVRIFAVARARSGYPAGMTALPDGTRIVRAEEFELVRYAPRLARRVRAVLDRFRKIPARPVTATTVTTSRGTGGTGTGTRARPMARAEVSAVGRRASAIIVDVWLRAYRVASLSLYWWQTASAAVAWRPDVIHANDGNTLAPAWWIARKAGSRIIYDAHELWRHRNVRTDRPVAPLVEHLTERAVIRRAAGVVTVSPSIADWLRGTYRLNETPTVVRNIPLMQEVAPTPADGCLRVMARLRPEHRVIAYGGRITTSRGIEETLLALRLLPENVHFVLLGYGEPDYVEPLKASVDHLGLDGRVHFVGKVAPDEVATALADADLSVVYVRPTCLSYRFSLPNKLFESIHGGLPVAVADLPDMRAIVDRYGVGKVFSLGSPEDMAATIDEILQDSDAFRAAATKAATELTWQTEASRLLALYHRVLAERPV